MDQAFAQEAEGLGLADLWNATSKKVADQATSDFVREVIETFPPHHSANPLGQLSGWFRVRDLKSKTRESRTFDLFDTGTGLSRACDEPIELDGQIVFIKKTKHAPCDYAIFAAYTQPIDIDALSTAAIDICDLKIAKAEIVAKSIVDRGKSNFISSDMAPTMLDLAAFDIALEIREAWLLEARRNRIGAQAAGKIDQAPRHVVQAIQTSQLSEQLQHAAAQNAKLNGRVKSLEAQIREMTTKAPADQLEILNKQPGSGALIRRIKDLFSEDELGFVEFSDVCKLLKLKRADAVNILLASGAKRQRQLNRAPRFCEEKVGMATRLFINPAALDLLDRFVTKMAIKDAKKLL
jgi:hypothetical protein